MKYLFSKIIIAILFAFYLFLTKQNLQLNRNIFILIILYEIKNCMTSKEEQKIIKNFIREILLKVFKRLPLNQKKVIFTADNEKELNDGNFLIIKERLLADGYNLIVDITKSRQKKDKRHPLKFIKYLYNLSTSKVILLTDFANILVHYERRENQKIVQLWHGLGAYKTFGRVRMDLQGSKGKNVHQNAYTHAITSSEFCRNVYAESFEIPYSSTYALGSPRVDILFDKNKIKEISGKIKKEYIGNNKKNILFAPTWRGKNLRHSFYDLENLNFELLSKKLGEQYNFIIKLHPILLMNNKLLYKLENIKEKYSNFIIDLTAESVDVNHILTATDILITDYSSIIFDYSILKRQVIYYIPDLEEYTRDRSFNCPFEDYVFGDIAKDTNEIINSVINGSFDTEKHELFYEKFMSGCKGESEKKVYELIVN